MKLELRALSRFGAVDGEETLLRKNPVGDSNWVSFFERCNGLSTVGLVGFLLKTFAERFVVEDQFSLLLFFGAFDLAFAAVAAESNLGSVDSDQRFRVHFAATEWACLLFVLFGLNQLAVGLSCELLRCLGEFAFATVAAEEHLAFFVFG
ncbi:hypothetical protein-transmembrane prediction [Rhodopirellula baltica SH 1]|uniref:Uncharacterized protein n=1 Tax=Rhodopirellula baltica (strain DSM 10527 / NCIMB 13988 / SH1) TaxID=243090 RepID=Q7UXR1_RHOBA|nr:hypothetical protein-transmembrane prediction [Rhodopirellula baltica SH 1]